MTGRYLVLMREDAVDAGVRALNDIVSGRVARARDFEGGRVDAQALTETEAIVFDDLAGAVVSAPPAQMRGLSATAETSGILAVEPERIVYAIDESLPARSLPSATSPSAAQASTEYLLGYREAVNHLVDQLVTGGGTSTYSTSPTGSLTLLPGVTEVDESTLTWGLQLTKVAESKYTGKGVRVAVLDTGMDLQHPDYVGRSIVSRSFIAGEQVQDGHGHGTHCIGTALGPLRPGRLPRYGVAYEAEIFAGKVLSNQGSGSDGGILAGINWAIQNKCSVISMSLGAATQPGDSFSVIYETIAKRALARGTLIIAAAGNESDRPGQVAPVGHPANCPSIIAVGAVDVNLQVAWFSSAGLSMQGGQVDIAGPGVNVHSSWPAPTLYRRISGTSMATPHVAGIAALHAEANPAMRGGTLAWLLYQNSRRLDLLTRDVGVGLVQAP